MKHPAGTFKTGDLVAVEWEDIQILSTGNPADASTAKRVTPGYFRKLKDKKLVVITLHKDDEPGDEGWVAFPATNVLSVTELVPTEKRWVK